ncbi:6-bladed beta-propeller [Aliifodinibius sp. S!AR15-10]|uniref:6-bladed beta-propeller n=1 Tax=Aliifodinibius sp. S!AR15-10 TaxID=2950437 RepID=UPI002859F15C|nr:6-bladed beta-propeller [Aliifodinibius sp. S!AR15-10]MDR8393822.1 6-bladed beta-propeller [Aliifodinibius sp. S!AR15-10]
MHLKLRDLSLFIAIILLVGCSSQPEVEVPDHIKELENLTVYPANPEPKMEIELIPEQTFGSTNEVLIGKLGSLGADSSGRVFIEDTDKKHIHVFAPDGSHITQFGREGRGPGEYRTIDILGTSKNRLFVNDPFRRRLSIYSLDSLNLLADHNMTPKFKSRREGLAHHSIGQLLQMDSDTYLAGFAPTIQRDPDSPRFNADSLYRKYYLLDNNGQFISEKIFEQRYLTFLFAQIKGETRSTAFRFMGLPLLTVSDNEHIYSALSTDFLIKVRDSTGNYQRAFYYPVPKRTFTREEALNYVDMDYHRSVIRNAVSADLPEYWHLLHSMKSDDKNRLWVSMVVEDQEVLQWWVLDKAGKLLARFTWPRSRSIEEIKDGYLYANETDDETGVAEIVRYRIDMQSM